MISFPIIKKLEKKSRKRTSKGQIQGREIEKLGYFKTDYVRFSCPAPNRTELN